MIGHSVISLTDKTNAYADKADIALNKAAGWNENAIRSNLNRLLEFGKVEVGYRSCCGSTDRTQKQYSKWLLVLKKMRADGLEVFEEVVKHDNAYATISGGFWHSTIYTLSIKEG